MITELFSDGEALGMLALAVVILVAILWPRPSRTIVAGAIIPPRDKKSWIPFTPTKRGTKQ